MEIRRRSLTVLVVAALILSPGIVVAQGLTGTLIVTVQDDNKAVLVGATVRISSPALIGGPDQPEITNASGLWRFLALSRRVSTRSRVEMSGFTR